MKKKILIFSISLLVLVSGFFAVFWGYVRTEDGVRQNSRVRATVTQTVTDDTTVIYFTIQNSSIRKYLYDDRHSGNLFLDRKVDGVYVEIEQLLKQRDDLAVWRKPCPAFGKSEDIEVFVPYWTLQGGLAPGEYRIRQKIYRTNLADAGFFAVATFTVTAD